MSDWFTRHGWARVHPGLIVGAVPLDANDVQVLSEEGVDRVLNLVEDREYSPGARLELEIAFAVYGIEERRLGLVDFGGLSPEALDAAVAVLGDWLDGGHVVYLHCRAGWQRSASVAAAVIARREHVDIPAALRRLRARKPTAEPLAHQRQDLLTWSAQHAARGRPRDAGAPHAPSG